MNAIALCAEQLITSLDQLLIQHDSVLADTKQDVVLDDMCFSLQSWKTGLLDTLPQTTRSNSLTAMFSLVNSMVLGLDELLSSASSDEHICGDCVASLMDWVSDLSDMVNTMVRTVPGHMAPPEPPTRLAQVAIDLLENASLMLQIWRPTAAEDMARNLSLSDLRTHLHTIRARLQLAASDAAMPGATDHLVHDRLALLVRVLERLYTPTKDMTTFVKHYRDHDFPFLTALVRKNAAVRDFYPTLTTTLIVDSGAQRALQWLAKIPPDHRQAMTRIVEYPTTISSQEVPPFSSSPRTISSESQHRTIGFVVEEADDANEDIRVQDFPPDEDDPPPEEANEMHVLITLQRLCAESEPVLYRTFSTYRDDTQVLLYAQDRLAALAIM